MKRKNAISKVNGLFAGAVVASMAAAMTIAGCGKDATQTAVSMQFGSYTARNMLIEFFLPSAYAATSDIQMCFKRLRFKQEGDATASDASQDEDNIDLELGEVTLTAGGTSLGEVVIPAATYKRIEFDLEKDCVAGSSGNSISFANGSGSFATQDRMTIKFEGTFVASEASQTVAMTLDQIITALNSVTAVGDIKADLEAVAGAF